MSIINITDRERELRAANDDLRSEIKVLHDNRHAREDVISELKDQLDIQAGSIEAVQAANVRLAAELENMEATNKELLEALKQLDEAFCANDYSTREARNFGRKALIDARAAIARATKGEAK